MAEPLTKEALAEARVAFRRWMDDWLGTLDARDAEIAALTAQLDTQQADAMIAHRWFAEHFGEIMNGRDFAIKCSMANDALSARTRACAEAVCGGCQSGMPRNAMGFHGVGDELFPCLAEPIRRAYPGAFEEGR